MRVAIPKGIRGGFPNPLVVSGHNDDAADYATHQTLAHACLVMGCRRRLTIPGPCYRVMDSSKATQLRYNFVARRENYSSSWRAQGFYKTDTESGQVLVEFKISTPALTAKTILLPFTGGVVREFVVDFEAGDASDTAYGVVLGYTDFSFQNQVPTDGVHVLTVYGYSFDPAEAEWIEV